MKMLRRGAIWLAALLACAPTTARTRQTLGPKRRDAWSLLVAWTGTIFGQAPSYLVRVRPVVAVAVRSPSTAAKRN